jgi:hypothetical protein
MEMILNTERGGSLPWRILHNIYVLGLLVSLGAFVTRIVSGAKSVPIPKTKYLQVLPAYLVL